MGAGASVEEHDVLKASPNLPNRYNEQEDFKRFRGEVVTWTPGSQASLPLNAATFEADIWGVITMEASEGSAAVSSAVESPNTSLAVLLQPGFPASSDDIRRDLPGFSPRLIAGLRRRAWQAHVATTDLLVGGDDDPAARQRGPWPARNLYLVQANASQEIPNWPADMPQPIPPHRLRVRHGVANRRRLLRSRPAARLRRATNEDTDIFEDDMDDGGGIGFSDLDSDVDLVFDDEEMLVNRPAAGCRTMLGT
ncbi:hypothetical protein AK812_SmicGene31587 [Symbiodinium microadriaticum]|uniref:Uncharacterized protein n=1 Tax=Symbiodinium microadriaticum TaxID=2951 RepID=A0A1Q9CWB8_SYMMI|nr:hypothetical protein AK812_SmicGene31587 [Symbiodinium microadriaticum]